MSLNSTPSAERVHIAFFGRRNSGKSSLINAVTGQELSIVSDVKGTTTDPVRKAMELLPLGPVVMIDTPGLDDEGGLGRKRMQQSYKVMAETDAAVLVLDSKQGMTPEDAQILEELKKRNLPYIIAWNKSDLTTEKKISENEISVSAKDGYNINKLKDMLSRILKTDGVGRRIIGDFIEANDFIALVVPIDESAPKGRLILPQQQTIRDILDSHANAIVVQTSELSNTLSKLGGMLKLVVTDSQAFKEVDKIVPDNLPLTSFSILFARYKGDLRQTAFGAQKLDNLPDGAKVLISEGCTHHRQCNDIGAVKLPQMIRRYTGRRIEFEWTSGTGFKEDLTRYDLIVHCGGCMLNQAEMQYRLKCASEVGVPITNYGIAIAKMTGILKRSLEIFGDDY